jgi:hypothetical protein
MLVRPKGFLTSEAGRRAQSDAVARSWKNESSYRTLTVSDADAVLPALSSAVNV